MKKIVFTQRVEIIDSYGERRDCADQNVAKFLYACGFLPIPIMNQPELVRLFWDYVKPDGILFAGGNDLAAYGGNAPERDETERLLLDYALKADVPLFGICRGMQMIADYWGTKLEKVSGHIKTFHTINGNLSRKSVNSYHGMGIKEVLSPLTAVARSSDGIVEAIKHKTHKVAGIMWHPEREDIFSMEDIDLISSFFIRGVFYESNHIGSGARDTTAAAYRRQTQVYGRSERQDDYRPSIGGYEDLRNQRG